jgi:CheY-like chemotaxis protein
MTHGGSKTILVVDDDSDILSLIVMLLEGEGYTVETAHNGREALQRVEQHLPDLILLDMNMPVMNGWEFARQFHARGSGQVPIVVLTAAEDARQRAAEIDATGWVGKPFDLEELFDAVQKYTHPS